MNESAILHIPDSQYCFAVGEKKLVIRLRMAKEDADASVTLIYAGKYQFQQSREQIPMEIRYTDRLYHYYETTLVLTDVRLAYVFCIRQQGTTYYFCEDGVVLQYDFAEGFYNFFQMPYINRNDVLPTVKWMKSAVFYQIFVDRFFCGNTKKDRSYINMEWGALPTPKSFAGGDLCGIIEKLDYLKELGIIEQVIPENQPLTRENMADTMEELKNRIEEFLETYQLLDPEKLLNKRYTRFRNL